MAHVAVSQINLFFSSSRWTCFCWLHGPFWVQAILIDRNNPFFVQVMLLHQGCSSLCNALLPTILQLRSAVDLYREMLLISYLWVTNSCVVFPLADITAVLICAPGSMRRVRSHACCRSTWSNTLFIPLLFLVARLSQRKHTRWRRYPWKASPLPSMTNSEREWGLRLEVCVRDG